ncbi:MAG TPA: ATP-dependent DNA helicase RecG [Thermodesulfobacteriota bacterium]|nr:ATP-dependent DNA helicase RecG [Thermodesulfobacteriota bacterium]
MTGELLHILEALERPLRFASRGGFQNIHKVKDLDQLVDDLTLKALSLSIPPDQITAIRSLRESFARYNELQLDGKKGLIVDSLNAIAKLKGFGQTSKPMTPLSRRDTGTGSQGKDLSHVPIQYVKGVGPKIAEILAKKGIRSVEDALFYSPRRYEDRRRIKRISELKPDTRETVMGNVILSGRVRTKTRELFQVVLSDGTGTLTLVWFQFNERYLRATYKKGATVILSGEVRLGYNDSLQIIHPRPEDVEVIDGEERPEKDLLNLNRIVPIYPLTEGIKQRRIRKIMKTITDVYSPLVPDCIPDGIKQRRRMIGLGEALSRVHFPSDSDRVVDLTDRASVYGSIPHRTLSFYEFLLMELGLALKKRDISNMPGISFHPTGKLTERLLSTLPFTLTPSQKRVLSEIEGDMRSESPMNRLLQGDVGSGKTIVALLSMLKAVECGYQTALMAPTEILAEQHLRSVLRYVRGMGLRVVLLKGGLSRRERDTYYEAIRSGEAQIAIGTHALLEERVEFNNLGFVVIDEQHRFGVIQRAGLRNKGKNPDVLVMTATPIPRTLAMTVYGDLDVSILDEMPPNRKEIKTLVFYEEKGARTRVYDIVRREIRKGRQAYVVYPLIEESESPDFKDLKYATQMAEELQNEVFPEFRVGLLHGRMKTEEKDEIMRRFASHDIDILVSTTVIEVGVDIPNATVMVVENAERFGLSQLHQLRGRIGRGEHESLCILMSGSKRTEDAQRRLSILERTSDGFKIAEADLMIRGPGDFLGTKQSGLPEFKFANLIRDSRILVEAREEAFRIVREDPTLTKYPALLNEVLKRWGERLDLAAVS